MNQRALAAEFLGTFTVVTALCGAALISAPGASGLVAVAFSVGLAVLIMTYAVGHISGAHFNPAVTVGLVAGGRFEMGDAISYIIAQVLGGILAALIVSMILAGAPASAKLGTFMSASNTYGAPGGFPLGAAFLIEVVTTALLLVVFMGATSKSAPAGFAPIAVGSALVLFYLVSIPVTNASLNPARSTATAVFAGGQALSQLWMFWLAPIIGGVIGGVISRWLQDE